MKIRLHELRNIIKQVVLESLFSINQIINQGFNSVGVYPPVMKQVSQNRYEGEIDSGWILGATENAGNVDFDVNGVPFNSIQDVVKEYKQNKNNPPKQNSSKSSVFENGPNGLVVISVETLEKYVPNAFAEADQEMLECLWVMLNQPEDLSYNVHDDYIEEWTETNEPELGEYIHHNWDDLVVDIDGRSVVVLCGSYDDEYGYFWDPKRNHWSSYSY